MASRKPLVIVNGQLQELPTGDSLNVPVTAVAYEPLVASGHNQDIPYIAGTDPVPSLLTTSDGDIICAPSAG